MPNPSGLPPLSHEQRLVYPEQSYVSNSSWKDQNSPRRVFAWSWMRAFVTTVNSVYSPSKSSTLSSNPLRLSWATDNALSRVAIQVSNASTYGALDLPRVLPWAHSPSQPQIGYGGTSTPTMPSCTGFGGLGIARELTCVGANLSTDTTCHEMSVFCYEPVRHLDNFCWMLLSKPWASRLAKPRGFWRVRKKRAMEPNEENCITYERDCKRAYKKT